jgi:predicted alpha/beta-hydrolase family hydrolase
MSTTTELRFEASKSAGAVSAILDRPDDARWLLVLGHGAGAGMRHPFMESAAAVLSANGIATFRYQFAYMEKGGRLDPQPVLLATVRSAVAAARAAAGDLPLIAGGKSMGGRMTSLAAAAMPLEGVQGLAFFGFPLHPAGQPGTSRAEHLTRVGVPMLFLQGTRDTLAELELLGPIVKRLPRAIMHVVDGADHSFAVLKKSGRTNQQVLEDLAATVVEWTRRLEENR